MVGALKGNARHFLWGLGSQKLGSKVECIKIKYFNISVSLYSWCESNYSLWKMPVSPEKMLRALSQSASWNASR
jgi:hypothetical protein